MTFPTMPFHQNIRPHSIALFRSVGRDLNYSVDLGRGRGTGARVSIALRFISPRAAPTDTMMQGKSLLNPYATPYVPLSNVIPGVSFERDNKATKKILGDAENNEVIENSADYQLLDSVSVDYDVQGLEKRNASDESSRKIGDPWNSDYTFQDAIPSSEKQSAVDDPNMVMDWLSSMFPNISMESLAELLNANHGDLNQTIDVLEQLEYEGDEMENSAEASATSNRLGDPPERANASGISSSI
ncbi:uncharacterized protein [Elaeis guineensis]|uniref:Polyadenylate-binding protein-interacting protein 6 isoform X2 n=1 Tax=Elaeis guineensis var. tenera TaxID=51953 RepID=A0A6I9RG97_ELAGV|nr:polyadenylate-binding protein-interacting protein 6 isoform X2 [Elaeis guineensis]